MRPKLLDKLVVLDLLPMFTIGIALFSSLWFAGGPLLEASKYLAQGYETMLVIHFLLLSIPVVLSFTFPMAILLSVLMGFGRLSGESEAVALFAAGIPFTRIALPAAVLGVIASLAGYIINNDIATSAKRQIDDLKTQVFKQIETDQALELPPQMTSDGKLQATVLIGKGVDPKAGIIRQVTITYYDKTGVPSMVIYADYAKYVQWPIFELHNVQITKLGVHLRYSQHVYMQTATINETPEMIAFLKADPDSLSFADLKRQVRGLRAAGQANAADARKAELAMWRRIAVPFASLVFAVIGSPLGLRPQRTAKYVGWTLAILIIFGYYVLYIVTENLSNGGTMSPTLAAFAPDIVGLVIGGALIYRASR